MITRIEKALIKKLDAGLGHLVKTVTSYGSELSSNDLSLIVRVVPSVWVHFGGITSTQAAQTDRKRYVVTATFSVIVATRNVRSEQSQRHGGPHKLEIGSYDLVYAVRKLLTNQDLTDMDEGLSIDYLYPKRVRSLTSPTLEKGAISVYACEFQTKWSEYPLDNNRFPTPEMIQPGEPGNNTSEPIPDPDDPDIIFIDYGGLLSEPDPDLLSVGVDFHQDIEKDADLSAIVELNENEDD